MKKSTYTILFLLLGILFSCKPVVGPTGGVPVSFKGNVSLSILGEVPKAAKIRAYTNASLTGDYIEGTINLEPSPSLSRAGGGGAGGSFDVTLYPTGSGTYYYFEILASDGLTWVAKPWRGDQNGADYEGTLITPTAENTIVGDIIDFSGTDILSYSSPAETIEDEIVREGWSRTRVPWKVLWYIAPRVEIDGNKQTKMTLGEIVESFGRAKEFENFVETSANGIVDIIIEPYVSKTTVVSFSGGAECVYFTRSAIPALDLEEIGDINSFDTVISTVRFNDNSSGNVFGHKLTKENGSISNWDAIYTGSGDMTARYGCDTNAYLHLFCYHLEEWFGSGNAQSTDAEGVVTVSTMPSVNDYGQYNYDTLTEFYQAYIGGSIQQNSGDESHPANKDEQAGVHWEWWKYTQTNPDGYDIDLQPPVPIEDLDDSIAVTGTVSVYSILPITSGNIIAIDGGGNQLGSYTLANFSNPRLAYTGVSTARNCGFNILLPRNAAPYSNITFTVEAEASNGYSETWSGLTSSLTETIAADATIVDGIGLSPRMKTVTLSGSVAGLVTEDMAAVPIETIYIEASSGTTTIGHTTVPYASGTNWSIITAPLSANTNVSIDAFVTMITASSVGDNINPCRYRVEGPDTTIRESNVASLNFNYTIPLITLSGTLRFTTDVVGLTHARLDIGNNGSYFYSTGGSTTAWSLITQKEIRGSSFKSSGAMNWSVKVPETIGSTYNIWPKIYTGFDGLYVEVAQQNIRVNGGRSSLPVGSSDINGISIVATINAVTVSGSAYINCQNTISTATIRAYLAASAKGYGYLKVTLGEYTFSAGCENWDLSWSMDMLPGLSQLADQRGTPLFELVNVSGTNIIYDNANPIIVRPLEPNKILRIDTTDVEPVELPQIKIWTSSEISTPATTASIRGSHVMSLDGQLKKNNIDGLLGAKFFSNTIWITTAEGYNLAWDAGNKLLDTGKLDNMSWSKSALEMHRDGWEISIPAFTSPTTLYFFVERDGKFYPASQTHTVQGPGRKDIIVSDQFNPIDLGWQYIYVEGTVEKMFTTVADATSGRNTGAMVYFYWDQNYTRYAGSSIISQNDGTFRIQLPLSKVGQTLYATFVAYYIRLGSVEDVDVTVGTFQAAPGQFPVPSTGGLRNDQRNEVNWEGGMFIPANNIMPDETP
ncbi:MAG: hypothetical protein LBM77_10140 [Spirochaetaceae bacterium]|jgi:hypothetical protein|nr:hypothetical protein [Spirochaetaceae bacterium]